jgi:pimeloyl-ACP methyl ester carboxylesterase
VLLHGDGKSLLAWRSVFDQLSGYADVITLDLPGSGLSAKPGDGYAPESTASRIVGALGVRCAFLVGHSLGGVIAAAAAAHSPQSLLGLVLIAPALARPPVLGRRPKASRPGGSWREEVVARYELLRGRFGGVHDPWWIAEDAASTSYDPWRDPDYERAPCAVVRKFDFDFLTPALAWPVREPVLAIWCHHRFEIAQKHRVKLHARS